MYMNLKKYFHESAEVKKQFIDLYEHDFLQILDILTSCLRKWNKILIAGNWWSAADAQHWAAELIGRYKLERKSFPAIALTTDTSILTAIGNDYWFDAIFSRQIAWLWVAWDVFIWISTSGNSTNIIQAIDQCKKQWIQTIALLWKWWWKIKSLVDFALIVPSDNTPRIQECHMTIYHTLCEEMESILTNDRSL